MSNFENAFNTDIDQAIDSEVYKSKIRHGGLYTVIDEEIMIMEGKE